MKHDLLHIQGKPYVLVPLHDYRQMAGNGAASESGTGDIPAEILDLIHARQEHPIKVLRKFRGLTQTELAKKAGISRPYLTEIETGRKEGSIAAIRALAEALQAPSSLLI